MVMMQGTLWKWTNYLSGWQPRWFVLDYGVLAYYRSQEEVHLGSRGSVKLSCCEICVHPTDPVRLDLKIPPENHMYLRAATSAERQQWLVALGTAKACRVDTSYQEQRQQMNSVEFLKEKMAELNTCRNIIVHQVHQLKSLCPSDQQLPSQEMNEAATMLSATCDSFLSNLSDMMEVVEDSLSTTSGSPVSTPIRIKAPPIFKKHSYHTEIGAPSPSSPSTISDSFTDSDRELLSPRNGSHHHQKSPTALQPPTTLALKPVSPNLPAKQNPAATFDEGHNGTAKYPKGETRERGPVASSVTSPSSATATTTSSSTNDNNKLYKLSQNSLESHSPEEVQKPEPKSFFSATPVRFEDVAVVVDGRIPTKTFLDACSAIVPVFDILGSTAFAPVKIDIQGNIKKIRTKFETDEKAFTYLQNMVFQELKSNTCTARNSTTDALLWLKRALEFIHVFLAEICRGEQDLSVAATNAYGRSLRKYHGWVVRGVFSLAVKAVPYRKDFMEALRKSGVNSDGSPTPEQEIVDEMRSCASALGKLVNILCQFYKRHKLDSESVV
ncbi:pleckstrin homology domain-containing family A member 8-like [Rhopilema esculentum]|uniref:pleckstrin homology domain-containing family A member 8-like n=1 Tax=Rhopilema esculentum TaxID=499914 RepID=UPI0031D037A7